MAAHQADQVLNPRPAAQRGIDAQFREIHGDLVEMTRIEAGALVVKREATALTDAVAAAVHDLRAELGRHHITLDVSPTLPLVEADPRMLHHVLINLLGNAAKFSPPGTDIVIEARRSPDSLTLAVLDHGPGLPDGKEAHLFDRFTRVDGGDRRGGTGLGLAIVQGFAQAMGLSVGACNRERGGSSFFVTWPGALIRHTTGG